MPSTNELLTAIAADLRSYLPALKTCAPHDGRWDAAELQRWSVGTPAVMIAWLGTVKTEQPGLPWTDCEQQLAAYTVTRDSPGLPRGQAARNLVDALLLYIPRARWDIEGLGEAENIKAENLFAPALDQTGVSICAVTWIQTLRLEALADGTCPPLPDELYSSAQDDPAELLHPETAA